LSISDSQRLSLPVERESGSYLEFAAPGECRIYDRHGSPVGEPSPTGPVPRLAAGPNRLAFSCDNAAASPRPRVRVTVMAAGPWIH